jgi:hypothetical protein
MHCMIHEFGSGDFDTPKISILEAIHQNNVYEIDTKTDI